MPVIPEEICKDEVCRETTAFHDAVKSRQIIFCVSVPCFGNRSLREATAVSSFNPMDLNRIVIDDPSWLWFLDPENYRPALLELEIEESDFLAAWNEILAVFPVDWARKAIESKYDTYGYHGIHPMPFGWLPFHPVAKFLAQKRSHGGWAQAAPVLRLGLYLVRTKSISGIKSIRRDLKNLEQFGGRLFELEVLSEFSRRGLKPKIEGTPDFSISADSSYIYLEARHRGVPFWMEVANRVHVPFGEKWHQIRVDLTYASGVRAEAEALAVEISAEIASLAKMEWDPEISIITPRYTIRHLKAGDPCTLVIGDRSDQRWSEEVVNLIYWTLIEKSKQLKQVAGEGYPNGILIDCRSLLLAAWQGNPEVKARHQEEVRSGILRAGDRFLNEHTWVSGIVWWWRTIDSPWSLPEILHKPWTVTLSTRAGHVEDFDPTTLTRTKLSTLDQ